VLTPYPTWQSASEAVRKLKINGIVEYRARRKENSMLPGNPHHAYKDYPGDTVFFGKA
jgi:hypothetical protein